MHDLVIRGGTVVDGTGAPKRKADVAIDGDRITAVGTDVGPGKREIDATGKIVAPGWVDIHTHYDAQVTWDPYVTPSGWHGVTTVVMGNCGVGFAPAKPEKRDWLIGLMEGVEDIPGAAMTEGMVWEWESFPEYMDALDKKKRALDIATQVPHGALRTYVMGRRGAKHEEATEQDIAEMARLVEEGVRAGALGFSTSRTLIHKGIDGEYVPGTFAGEAELLGIGRAIRKAGWGVFQMTSNHTDMPKEFSWMHKLSKETGLPVSFNLLQTDAAPNLWKEMLGMLDEARKEGVSVFGQVAGRPNGILMTWSGTAIPFLPYPSYMKLHHMPVEERLVELRKPEVREAILAEEPFDFGEFENFIIQSFHKMYRLDPENPDYEPDPSQSAQAIADAQGTTAKAVVYDWLMENDGNGIVYFPIFNYSDCNFDALRELLTHPGTGLGLSDGGAHCGAVCDASVPTFMLTHWARDRKRGPTIELEEAIHIQTRKTALVYGLHDRGVLAPEMLADVNIIDFDNLHLAAPYMAYDLPADGRRLVQKASGYEWTIKSGVPVFRDGEPTGELPGVLIRGPRKDPRPQTSPRA